MTDVIFFCGPVVVTAAHKSIDWYGRDVRIIAVTGDGSSYFSSLAESLRDKDGRILPALIARYAKGLSVDSVTLAAYSAGYGLLDKICDIDVDRKQVTALILGDACFSAGNPKTGEGGTAKAGFVKFGREAGDGNRLMVATTANTTDGSYLTGRQSFLYVWQAIHRGFMLRATRIVPRAPVPPASGGWWRIGSECYWGDYTKPGSAGSAGSDLTHAQHNDLTAAVMQAYLAPWLAGRRSLSLWKLAVGVALASALGIVVRAVIRRKKS